MKKIVLELSDSAFNRLQQLKQLTESKDNSIMIAKALSLYDFFNEKSSK